ncbi:MAG: hypothetical protein JNN17_05645 [Verrucomicrobiaceae bacterium]|nr:hypothetical protein [Verrucomicrobiaceae bacterium]
MEAPTTVASIKHTASNSDAPTPLAKDDGQFVILKPGETFKLSEIREPYKPLTSEELASLRANERIIEKGLETFIDVGTAMATIRDGGLFRATHKSFEEYVKDKWDYTRQRAYQLISASDFHTKLASRNSKMSRITSERATRALMTVPNDRLADVLDAVLAEGEPTAERIVQIRNKIAPAKAKSDTKQKKKPMMKIEVAIKAASKWLEFLSSCNPNNLGSAHAKEIVETQTKVTKAFTKLKFAI